MADSACLVGRPAVKLIFDKPYTRLTPATRVRVFSEGAKQHLFCWLSIFLPDGVLGVASVVATDSCRHMHKPTYLYISYIIYIYEYKVFEIYAQMFWAEN